MHKIKLKDPYKIQEEKTKMQNDLHEYCKLDALVMVKIFGAPQTL